MSDNVFRFLVWIWIIGAVVAIVGHDTAVMLCPTAITCGYGLYRFFKDL
jgi:hypothetical protein